MALGNRYCKIIVRQDSFSTSPLNSAANNCLKGILTEPKLMFMRLIISKITIKMINVFRYDFMGTIKFVPLKK